MTQPETITMRFAKGSGRTGLGEGLGKRARSRQGWLVPVLIAGMLGSVVAGLMVGAVKISFTSVWGILAGEVGIPTEWSFTEREAVILLHLRMPRVLAGLFTGAALALGGVLMQALFRNPLADPGLIGVSSGAAMAAAVFMVLGGALPWLGVLPTLWALPAVAFGGAVAMTVVVIRIAGRMGETRVEHLLLAGIAMNALAGAVIGLLMVVADDAQLREVAFWSFGSLGRAGWPVTGVLAVTTLPVLVAAVFLHSWLNALLLGEREAAYLGVPVEGLKRGMLVLTCIAVGSAVSFTGLIGFVGLVVPHLVRLIAGPNHRGLVPASALLGGTLLTLADLLARTVVAPVELPIGLVTALLGAPFFLALLMRDKRGGGVE
ncbi:MAG TPA: iron ABC transporter permease [Kiritimatiellia bacterium]|nr:iron ABC transporter permease [Kiritimatiellia bacterium]